MTRKQAQDLVDRGLATWTNENTVHTRPGPPLRNSKTRKIMSESRGTIVRFPPLE